MTLDSAIPILIVAMLATVMSFQIAKESASKGKKMTGIFFAGLIGLAAWALLSGGFDNVWPSAVGWVAFLAGAIEALATPKEKPLYEFVPSPNPKLEDGQWLATLFCQDCKIETRALRTFPPSPCPRCGKPLSG